MPGYADKVGGGELGPGTLVAVVVEHFAPRRLQVAEQASAGLVGGAVAGLEVEEGHVERRHGRGPDDPVVVVARLDDRGDETARTDAVGPHVDVVLLAV